MVAQPQIIPDKSEILRHLRHVTRRWPELGVPVKMEIVFITAHDVAEVRQVARFGLDDAGLADAAEHVAVMNQHRLNAYVTVNPIKGAAEIKAGARASAEHIEASFFHWADCDSAEAAANLKALDLPAPTFFVMTGRHPHPRPHAYFELKEPTRDFVQWTATQRAIAAHLGSDRMVVDPPRIMRLAGTINWPKPKKQALGYQVELTTLHIYEDRKLVTSESMARAFPVAAPQAAAGGFQIDAGYPVGVDRQAAVQAALTGEEWHNNVIRLVASYVAKGLTDPEIHALIAPLTLPGYTADQTAREVQVAIDGARRKGWTPQERPEPQITPAPDAAPPEAAPKLRYEWFDDVAPALADAYLVKGVLAQGAMAVIYGPSNAGKTFWAMDIVFHIAIGAPWRGRRVRQASVLYLAAEGGRATLNRIAAIKQETGICDVPFALRRAGMDLLRAEADLQLIYDLAVEVQSQRKDMPLVIVIDTLSRVMAGGDENSAMDMTALIRNIDKIRELTGAAIILVHHTGKDAARGARGHSSLRAATDTEIEVQNEDGNRAAVVTKQRDYAGGETFAFSLKSVTLGHDQDGDAVTSCVVEEADSEEHQAAMRRTKGLGGVQKTIAETFDQMLGEGLGRPNPGGVGMPERGRFWCVDRAELRRLCMGKIEATDPRSSFNKAFMALTADRGLFATGENVVWRIDRQVSK